VVLENQVLKCLDWFYKQNYDTTTLKLFQEGVNIRRQINVMLSEKVKAISELSSAVLNFEAFRSYPNETADVPKSSPQTQASNQTSAQLYRQCLDILIEFASLSKEAATVSALVANLKETITTNTNTKENGRNLVKTYDILFSYQCEFLTAILVNKSIGNPRGRKINKKIRIRKRQRHWWPKYR